MRKDVIILILQAKDVNRGEAPGTHRKQVLKPTPGALHLV